MNKITLYLFFLLAFTSFNGQSEVLSKNEFIFEESEIIYFFSYECNSCISVNSLISAWRSASGSKVYYVPVFNNGKWRSSARFHFLLQLSKRDLGRRLNDSEIRKIGYSLFQANKIILSSKSDFYKFFIDNGMSLTITKFNSWWKTTDIMMLSTEQILNDIGNIPVPSVLVRSNGKYKLSEYDEQFPAEILRDMNRGLN